MKLTNSKGTIFTIDPLDLIEQVNKYGIDHMFHPKEILVENPQDGDWAEYFSCPTANGIFNPESGQVEFCTPYWCGELTDVKIKKMVFKNGLWHYDIDRSERAAFPGCTPEY